MGKYKGVSQRKYKTSSGNTKTWTARLMVNGRRWQRSLDNERDAAIAYDRKLIELGRPPVNILKAVL